MRNLFIPPLGTELMLALDWNFELFNEYRNGGFMKAMKDNRDTSFNGYPGFGSKVATLPIGTVLTLRRIYIRQGQDSCDSVTFSTRIGKKLHRFWVKLADANAIVLAT